MFTYTFLALASSKQKNIEILKFCNSILIIQRLELVIRKWKFKKFEHYENFKLEHYKR